MEGGQVQGKGWVRRREGRSMPSSCACWNADQDWEARRVPPFDAPPSLDCLLLLLLHLGKS